MPCPCPALWINGDALPVFDSVENSSRSNEIRNPEFARDGGAMIEVASGLGHQPDRMGTAKGHTGCNGTRNNNRACERRAETAVVGYSPDASRKDRAIAAQRWSVMRVKAGRREGGGKRNELPDCGWHLPGPGTCSGAALCIG